MKQIIISAILSLLTVLLLPTPVAAPQETQPPVRDCALLIETRSSTVPEETPSEPVSLLVGAQILELDEDDYLTAVVLCEMPPSFEPEALKAQAVAARTFLYAKRQHPKHDNAQICSDPSCCQAWQSQNDLQSRFGADFEAYMEKAAAAVESTKGQLLLYEGDCIEAAYFSCSGGKTEAAQDVWGGQVPYLQSVDSPGEEDAPRYESEVCVPAEQFRGILLWENPAAKLDDDPSRWLGARQDTRGGGVSTYTLGGVSYSGVCLRRLFDLNSTCFRIEYADSCFVFHVRGFGHRVGMSQYGANHMAREGASYVEILNHYYPGALLCA